MEDDAPPPYSPASPSLSSVSSLLSSQLRSLPGRISSARAERSSARDGRDGEILSLVVPHIEELIHTVTVMDPPPDRLEMTLVPEEAVGDDWKFSDEGPKHTLVKIGQHKTDVKKSAPSREAFDDLGRWDEESAAEALWWNDDEMASRLAKHLQPEQPRPKSKPQPAPEPPKKSGWGFFKKTESVPVFPRPAEPHREEPVSLTVRAEEVTFRRENEMGIWESKRGWGLVVRIRVRQ